MPYKTKLIAAAFLVSGIACDSQRAVAPAHPRAFVTPVAQDPTLPPPKVAPVAAGVTLPVSVHTVGALDLPPRSFLGISSDAAALSLAGTPSLIWFATDGTATIWKMFGPVFAGDGSVPLSIPYPWKLATTADLNGDGNPDFIWEAVTDGSRAVTYMNGPAYAGYYQMLFQFSPDWKIVGSGDFNSDTKPDLVLTNTATNQHGVLLLNGTTFLTFQSLPYYGVGWRPVAVADMNGDSKSDLVYIHDTQPQYFTSLLNGTSVIPGTVSYIWPLATNWRIGAAADFNYDGRGDLVIQNTSDGQRQIQYMDYDPTFFVVPASESVALPPVSTLNSIIATALIKFPAAALNLKLQNYYVAQTVQDAVRSVPLIAGRPAIVRAFVNANDFNIAAPVVRVRITQPGGAFDDYIATRPGDPGVPVVYYESLLNSTYNVTVPGSVINPGSTISVSVDPGNLISETNESDNAVTELLVVRTLPRFDVRFVPVRLSGGETGDVTNVNAPNYMKMTMKVWPFASYDADVHSIYTTTQSELGSLGAWNTILSEMANLRVVEGSSRYYYGVLPRTSVALYAGYGYIGYPAAIGLSATSATDTAISELNAHEWGHNFGRPHSACGVPDPDPSYPVPSGHTDSWGYNTAELKTYSPTLYYDIMSYCTPKWVAGYTVKQMMNFVGPAAAAAPAEAATSTLIVWGHIGAEGAVVLEPAFEVNTLPKRPEGHGAFAIEGRDASGSVMFSDRFEGVEVGDGAPGERHFAFAIPMSHENAARLRKIQIVRATTRAPLGAKSAQATIDAVAEAEPAESVQAVSGGMEVKWNSRTYPMVMVRDALTGEVISFARGGDARLRSRGGRAVDLIFSDGVHSRTKRVNPL